MDKCFRRKLLKCGRGGIYAPPLPRGIGLRKELINPLKIQTLSSNTPARVRVFDFPGTQSVVITATATVNEVLLMKQNLGLRQESVILRACPMQAHHKFVVLKRPPDICDPEGRVDKSGNIKPEKHNFKVKQVAVGIVTYFI